MKFVRIIHYYSKLFTGVLRSAPLQSLVRAPSDWDESIDAVSDVNEMTRFLIDAGLIVPAGVPVRVGPQGAAKLASNFCKFLAGSFSAVSKRNFARK